MPSQANKEKVEQITKLFENAPSLLVLRYRGLTVHEANEFRGKLKEMNSELRVLKNTLTRIAIAGTPKEGIVPLLEGPVAVVTIRDDVPSVAKVVREFARGRKDFYLRGGLFESRILDGKQVEALATLPPRDILLAQMVGMVRAPLALVVGAAVAPARKMLALFQALADKKGSGEPPSREEVGDGETPEEA
ncbi:MAG: 50S ribosomal protein L10 [Candidatus Anoxymicrobium japonicum]|uniref:Large ribosomal subunit protein uL10 n=1 Tax=Candidatus Anoxymicrobium japonicum TaxID=2013648 RepID=A0A2N3G5E7_9ACTN|nr:MAG: 50S ribosomal protein L10 [Candidatus Anoxymicrobium japonicum]